MRLWGHYNKLATQEVHVQYTEPDMWVEGLIGKTWILRLKMKNKLHMYRSMGLFCDCEHNWLNILSMEWFIWFLKNKFYELKSFWNLLDMEMTQRLSYRPPTVVCKGVQNCPFILFQIISLIESCITSQSSYPGMILVCIKIELFQHSLTLQIGALNSIYL